MPDELASVLGGTRWHGAGGRPIFKCLGLHAELGQSPLGSTFLRLSLLSRPRRCADQSAVDAMNIGSSLVAACRPRQGKECQGFTEGVGKASPSISKAKAPCKPSHNIPAAACCSTTAAVSGCSTFIAETSWRHLSTPTCPLHRIWTVPSLAQRHR